MILNNETMNVSVVASVQKVLGNHVLMICRGIVMKGCLVAVVPQ